MHRRPKKFRKCKSCHKNRYPSHPLAVNIAAERMAVNIGLVISVYECPVVRGTFHLTKMNPIHYQKRKLLVSRSVESLLPGPGSLVRL